MILSRAATLPLRCFDADYTSCFSLRRDTPPPLPLITLAAVTAAATLRLALHDDYADAAAAIAAAAAPPLLPLRLLSLPLPMIFATPIRRLRQIFRRHMPVIRHLRLR